MVRDEMDFIREKEKELPSLFIVSQVELKESAGTSVKIEKADGEKCVRCWNYSTQIGTHKDFPGICPKCVKALS